MAGLGTPCVMCGKVPTTTVPIQRNVGMVLLRRSFTIKKPLCKIHGRQVAREYLGKTLLWGWWGVISVFFNIFMVLGDLKALSAFRALPEPSLPGAAFEIARDRAKATPVVAAQGQWLQDPYSRHQFRWIVGSQWSEHVSDNGELSVDPPGWIGAPSSVTF